MPNNSNNSVELQFAALFGLYGDPVKLRMVADSFSGVVNLLIECLNKETFDRLYSRSSYDFLAKRAIDFGLNLIVLSYKGQTRLINPNLRGKRIVIKPVKIEFDLTPDWETLEDLVFLEPDVKVIQFEVSENRLEPGFGLLTGKNCHKTSGLTPEQWQGQNMRASTPKKKTWEDEDWQQFCNVLISDGYDRWVELEWCASLYDGQRVKFKGQARLVIIPDRTDKDGTRLRGGLGRVVKVLDTQLLND